MAPKRKDDDSSLIQNISIRILEVVDPEPDFVDPEQRRRDNQEKWARVVKSLKDMQCSEDRLLGLETAPHSRDDDTVSLAGSLVETAQEHIGRAMNEVLDPKPDPTYRDDDSLIDRVVDQAFDDEHSLVSHATIALEVVMDEVIDPKPTEDPNWNAACCTWCY